MLGYHYYRKYGEPQVKQKLECVHEKYNPYDVFDMKTGDTSSGITVGHLPIENSRITKFLLNRGATVFEF